MVVNMTESHLTETLPVIIMSDAVKCSSQSSTSKMRNEYGVHPTIRYVEVQGIIMPYETLYRRYRPQTFDELIGQPHIVQTLKNALKLGRVAHAYLFAGQRGTGKTTAARLLAKALNCEHGPTPDPCGGCESCLAIQTGSSMDVVELDAASHTKVEQIRELIVNRVGFMPVEARYRVYIIDEAHMLSLSSFNALLKTLEEPPPHAIFVLATTDPHKIPATIHSRCQRLDFRPVPPQLIAERMEKILMNEKKRGAVEVDVSSEALSLVARAAQGSVRDALSILEQLLLMADDRVDVDTVRALLGMVSEELLKELVTAIAAGDVGHCWRLVQTAVDEGKDMFQLVRDLTEFLRELMLVSMGADEALGELTSERLTSLQGIAGQLSQAQLTSVIDCLREAEREMRISEDVQLALELGLLRATTAIHRKPIHEMVEEAPTGVETETPSEVSLRELPMRVPKPVAMGTTRETIAPEGAQLEEAPLPPELAEVRQAWPEVLERIRRERVSTYALLQEGLPMAVDGDVLTVALTHPFHKEYLQDPEHSKLVEHAVEQVLAKNYRLRFVLSDEAERQVAVAEQVAQPAPIAVSRRSREPQQPPLREANAQADPTEIIFKLFPDAQVVEEMPGEDASASC